MSDVNYSYIKTPFKYIFEFKDLITDSGVKLVRPFAVGVIM